jgi:hypothetical protein
VSSARETVLSTLQRYLWAIEWNGEGPALVTRNARREVDVDKLPAIFILSLPDDVIVKSHRGPGAVRSQTRDWQVGVASFISGTSPEAAPTEIELFQDVIKAAIADAMSELQCQASETQADDVLFPEDGNNVVGQALWFQIIYTETVE